MSKEIVKNKRSASERFTSLVISKYADIAKGIEVTDKEKAIIAGYYIVIDKAIKSAKNPIKWSEVDLESLALDLAHNARLGLDMQMPNHLFVTPFKNTRTNEVSLTLVTGYEGEKHLAYKFAQSPPLDIRVELVHKNDKFVPHKKNMNNPYDTYEFEISNPFDRGEIIGGFGYIAYEEKEKNTLVIMSETEILKRKPSYAGEQFWGKWKEKMYAKTIMKETCRHILIDVDKVREYRDSREHIDNRDVEYAKIQADAEIVEEANTGEVIDFEEAHELEEVNGSGNTITNLAKEEVTLTEDEKKEIMEQEFKAAEFEEFEEIY